MLKFMERATIYYLKQKGWSNVQIAEFTGHHRDTIAKVLKEEIDQKPKKRDRKSAASVFDVQIHEWLDQDQLCCKKSERDVLGEALLSCWA